MPVRDGKDRVVKRRYKAPMRSLPLVAMDDSFPGFFSFMNQPFRPLVFASRATHSVSVSVPEREPALARRVKQPSASRSFTAAASMAFTQYLTVTVLPASTKAGEETIRALLALSSKSESKVALKVNAIYRDPCKAPAEFTFLPETKFTAVKGNVGDLPTTIFKDSDVVFYIPPPTYDGTDTNDWAVLTANNVKAALSAAAGKVKRLVLFSAIGAQHESGIGILKLNHLTDEILTAGDVNVPEKVVVRPGYFVEGFGSFLEEALGAGEISSWLTPLDYPAPVVSVKDIASTCAKEILKPCEDKKASPKYIKIFGPRHYSAQDLHEAISTVLNKKDIKLNAVPPEHLDEYFGHVFPKQYVQEFVDMTTAVLPGGVMANDFGYDDEDENTAVVRGETELVDAIRPVYEGMLRKEEQAKEQVN